MKNVKSMCCKIIKQEIRLEVTFWTTWCSQMTKPSCEVKLSEQDVRNYRPLYEKIAECDRKQYNTLIRITDNTMKNEKWVIWEMAW